MAGFRSPIETGPEVDWIWVDITQIPDPHPSLNDQIDAGRTRLSESSRKGRNPFLFPKTGYRRFNKRIPGSLLVGVLRSDRGGRESPRDPSVNDEVGPPGTQKRPGGCTVGVLYGVTGGRVEAPTGRGRPVVPRDRPVWFECGPETGARKGGLRVRGRGRGHG